LQVFCHQSKLFWMTCHYCKLRCTLDSFLPSTTWSLLPSNTWRTDISNALPHDVPTLLFPSPSLVGARTCWSASWTWQADVSSNPIRQAVTLFL
jgi:hypothetical protein